MDISFNCDKMAMHNGFEIPGAPKKRRGRKPKATA